MDSRWFFPAASSDNNSNENNSSYSNLNLSLKLGLPNDVPKIQPQIIFHLNTIPNATTPEFINNFSAHEGGLDQYSWMGNGGGGAAVDHKGKAPISDSDGGMNLLEMIEKVGLAGTNQYGPRVASANKNEGLMSNLGINLNEGVNANNGSKVLPCEQTFNAGKLGWSPEMRDHFRHHIHSNGIFTTPTSVEVPPPPQPPPSPPHHPSGIFNNFNNLGLPMETSVMNNYVLLNFTPRKVQREMAAASMRAAGRRGAKCQRPGGYCSYLNVNRRCSNINCNTGITPMWRYGPLGPNTLCNACGIKYRKLKGGETKRNNNQRKK